MNSISHSLFPSIVLSLALAILLRSSTVASMAAEYPKASVAGDSAFASSLYGKLAAGSGNLFFSPYSIRIALAMTYSGARGNTAEEMQSALRFKLAQQQTPAALKALTDELIAD